MGEGAWLILFVVVQRLAELAYAQRNTQRLLRGGAVEFGRAHYPLIVLLHILWLAALWIAGRDHMVHPLWLAVFIVLQVGRIWVIATLGSRWTTRVIVMPGAPLIEGGPYRYVRHPNYLIVLLETAVVPLALGLPVIAAAFTVANALLLHHRIGVENSALKPPTGN